MEQPIDIKSVFPLTYFFEGFHSPRIPVKWIAGMLQQVWAFLFDKAKAPFFPQVGHIRIVKFSPVYTSISSKSNHSGVSVSVSGGVVEEEVPQEVSSRLVRTRIKIADLK